MAGKPRKAKCAKASNAEQMVKHQIFRPEAFHFYVFVLNVKRNLDRARPLFLQPGAGAPEAPKLAAMIDRVAKRVEKVLKTNPSLEHVVRLADAGTPMKQIAPDSDEEFAWRVFNAHYRDKKSYPQIAADEALSAELIRKTYKRWETALENWFAAIDQLAKDAKEVQRLAMQHFGEA